MENTNQTETQVLTAEEKVARGAAWMTASNIISRLLGAIYIIPWYAWMGEHAKTANGLFNMGYNIYALFLLISTAGLPAAIAKQTAYYNSLNEYKTSQRLFKKALQMMGVFGIIAAGLMYLASPWLASISGGGEDLVPVMRSLSVALVIFPSMSVIRGYFQGNQDLMPYALSQIVEQVARVFYMLLTAFIIMKVMQGNYVSAVVQSTFAAFIGMIASMAVLLYFLKKHQVKMEVYIENSSDDLRVETKELLIETIRQAIPFIIVGSGITIFKLVDQVTFISTMEGFTNYSQTQLMELFSLFSANPDKLTMVVIALGTSMATAGLPLITEKFTLKKKDELAHLISNNIQLFAFVMLPATFGMILLAYPLNTLFYSPDTLGSKLLIEACFAGLFLGLYMLISSMLQGMYQNMAAIKYLGVGLAVKLLIQIPFIGTFEVYGPLLATMIGFAVSCGLILRKIYRVSGFDISLTARRCLLMWILSLGMYLAGWLTRSVLYLFLSPESKFQSLIIILLVAAVGGVVYMILSLKVRIADILLGDRVNGIRQKLHIR